MSVEVFLMAMQAAGAISDIMGTKDQQATLRQGAMLEQQNIQTQLEETQLAFSLASIDAMKGLRTTLATQRAMFAARGQQAGAGSALAIGAKAVHEHGLDERIRKMNLLSREHALRGQQRLSAMHAMAGETELGQKLSQRLFQQIPFSEIGKGFGAKNNKSPASIGSVNRSGHSIGGNTLGF